MRAALENQKADLEAQYQALMEEREQIEQMTSEALSDAARNELNQRIATFNSQAEAYETHLNDFNQKVSDYNQKILSKKQAPPDD
jgi:predicted  nucleic acid-binding Zn-ribbon protein